MTNYIIALVLGMFFGFSLNKSGLTKYHKIVNVFRFTDMAVLKFMMTALVVAMSGLYALRGLGLVTFLAHVRQVQVKAKWITLFLVCWVS